MKFTRKDYPTGAFRKRRRFLLIPKLLITPGGEWQWRWLEWAWILETYSPGHTVTGFDWTPRGWHPCAWTTKIAYVPEPKEVTRGR